MSNQAAVREQKKQVVGEIKSRIENGSLMLITEYRGMSMAQMTELRRLIQGDGGCMTVFKNTLSRFALKELSIEFPETMLEGPTALINTTGDVAKISKAVTKFAKDVEVFKIRGGILENKVIQESTIQELATLPSREELIAKVIGGIKSPLTSLVAVLSTPARGLVYALDAVKKQKENQ
jgi:large subunit ribosomal protein L10